LVEEFFYYGGVMMRYLPTTAKGVEFIQSMAKGIGKYTQVDDKDDAMLDSLNEMID
jgi:hypothetical protein